jgi:hypothetical protein
MTQGGQSKIHAGTNASFDDTKQGSMEVGSCSGVKPLYATRRERSSSASLLNVLVAATVVGVLDAYDPGQQATEVEG